MNMTKIRSKIINKAFDNFLERLTNKGNAIKHRGVFSHGFRCGYNLKTTELNENKGTGKILKITASSKGKKAIMNIMEAIKENIPIIDSLEIDSLIINLKSKK